MDTPVLQLAKDTILTEQQALLQLALQLDNQFEQAVNALQQCSGRIVLSGIGKSAIIAQKIVATLNSTGTLALFMHAADAIHGDLGMIQPNDVALIISNSGESAEIKVLAPLVKSRCQVLIGMVGNTQSFLARQSDIVLNSTVDKEACPHNLAPTSSTTAQMVLGDALAVCLIEAKKFSPADFALLHPGGNLGKRLHLRVSDLYTQNAAPQILADASLKSVIIEISKGRVGATAVIDKAQKVVGIITDGDVRRLLEKTDNISGIMAQDILTANPKTITPDLLAINALEIIKTHDVGQLIVADNAQKFLGFLHIHDLIREGIY